MIGQKQEACNLKNAGYFRSAHIYLLENIPLDGCIVMGDNDIGLFQSEIGFKC
jgi:hypothetical protein